jgi:hypothetical protein
MVLGEGVTEVSESIAMFHSAMGAPKRSTLRFKLRMNCTVGLEKFTLSHNFSLLPLWGLRWGALCPLFLIYSAFSMAQKLKKSE